MAMNKSNRLMFTAGRILFALPFGIIGLNHFLMYDYYAGMVTSFIPGGGFTVLLTGFCLIAASISIIAKKFITISCILLAALLLIFILSIHIPQLFNPDLTKDAIMQLLKDTGLMGGALIVAAIYKEEKKEEIK
jgi:putative oxidoreductase